MAALRKLVILGAGGFGREVLAWARQSEAFQRDWEIKGFLDNNVDALAGKPSPVRILGRIDDYQPVSEDVFVCAIGNPAAKRRSTELIAQRSGQFITLVHRTAAVGNEVHLGPGVILCPHSVVSGYNKLGRGVVVNLFSSVDHDATVGDWTQINCHCDLTGGVRVGVEVWFSSHVAVAPGITIGDQAYLGIGAVVVRDVEPRTKVFGVPARRVE